MLDCRTKDLNVGDTHICTNSGVPVCMDVGVCAQKEGGRHSIECCTLGTAIYTTTMITPAVGISQYEGGIVTYHDTEGMDPSADTTTVMTVTIELMYPLGIREDTIQQSVSRDCVCNADGERATGVKDAVRCGAARTAQVE